MNKVKIIIAYCFTCCIGLGCVNDNFLELGNQSNFEILENCYESPRVTFGKIPKDNFYTTVFN